MNTTATDSVLVRILKYNEGRKARLVRLKLKRMQGDPFAFFRGTDHLFADSWASLQPPDVGPELPICGDLHLENFGAFRGEDGDFLYDINDFDEAALAPCSLDLVRCATSIYLAAEEWKLSPLCASGMVLTYLDEYRATVTHRRPTRDTDAEAPRLARGPIGEILGKTAVGDQGELLDAHTERHKDGVRQIVRCKKRHPELKEDRRNEITAAVEAFGVAKGRPGFFQVIDATGRVAGVGSLGLERFLVLVAGGGSSETNQLLDVKACRPSAIAPCASSWPFDDPSEAARVVRAERVLLAQPPAEVDVLPVGGEPFRVREMIPEENRSSLDRFHKKPIKLRAAIQAAGLLTGLSHRRGAEAVPGGDVSDRLRDWASGPALDSVLAAAARFAESTRLAHGQYLEELKSPAALPRPLRKQFAR